MIGDWLENLTPLPQPIRGKRPHAFSRALSKQQVFTMSFDWLTLMRASVVIGQCNQLE